MILHFGSGGQSDGRHVLTRPRAQLTEPIPAAGPDYTKMMVSLKSRLSSGTTALQITAQEKQQPAEPLEAVFNNLATLKVATSKLAMHLSDRYRTSLFDEVDRLLNIENWDDDSSLVDVRSFETFLRAVLYNRIGRMPSLGISQGLVLAAWHGRKGAQRLYVEFLPDDRVKVLLTTAGATSASDESATLVAPSSLLRVRLTGLGFDEMVLDANE
jgi:hypothetical protein